MFKINSRQPFKAKIYGVNIWMKSVGFDRKRKGHIYFDEVTYN